MKRLTVIALGLLAPALFAIPLTGLLLSHNQGLLEARPVPVINEATPAADTTATDTTNISETRIPVPFGVENGPDM